MPNPIKLPPVHLPRRAYLVEMPCVAQVDDESDLGDGLWVYLRDGWHWEMHTVHEDNLGELKKAMRLVEPDDPTGE